MRECHMCHREVANNHFQCGDFVRSVCDECLEGEGFDINSHHDISTIYRTIYEHSESVHEQPDQLCPGCGLTIGRFVTTMRVGCRQCYETFAAIVDVISTSPEVDPGNDPVIEQQLAAAIMEERYEDAADIRDMMEAMKND